MANFSVFNESSFRKQEEPETEIGLPTLNFSIQKYRIFYNRYLPRSFDLNVGEAVFEYWKSQKTVTESTINKTSNLAALSNARYGNMVDIGERTALVQKCDASEQYDSTSLAPHVNEFFSQGNLKEVISLSEAYKRIKDERGSSVSADPSNDPGNSQPPQRVKLTLALEELKTLYGSISGSDQAFSSPDTSETLCALSKSNIDGLTQRIKLTLTPGELKRLYGNDSGSDQASFNLDTSKTLCTHSKANVDGQLTNKDNFEVSVWTETFKWVNEKIRRSPSAGTSHDLHSTNITKCVKPVLMLEDLKTTDEALSKSDASTFQNLDSHQTPSIKEIVVETSSNNCAENSNSTLTESKTLDKSTPETIKLLISQRTEKESVRTFKPFLRYCNEMSTILEDESFNIEDTIEPFSHPVNSTFTYNPSTQPTSRSELKYQPTAGNTTAIQFPSSRNKDLKKLLNKTGIVDISNVTLVPSDTCLEPYMSPSMISFRNHEKSCLESDTCLQPEISPSMISFLNHEKCCLE